MCSSPLWGGQRGADPTGYKIGEGDRMEAPETVEEPVEVEKLGAPRCRGTVGSQGGDRKRDRPGMSWKDGPTAKVGASRRTKQPSWVACNVAGEGCGRGQGGLRKGCRGPPCHSWGKPQGHRSEHFFICLLHQSVSL